jgi:tetratricopeptide (TPR) repeat protein
MAARMAVGLVDDQVRAMHEETDPQMAEQAIPGSLKILEGLLKSDPDNREVLSNLAEGYCSYAFSFVEDRDGERAARLYWRGRDYALAGLGGGREWLALPPVAFASALQRLGGNDVPSLFWLSQCWAGWLLLNLHDTAAFADISRVEQSLLRALEMDETFYHAGPNLLAGAFYGGRTKILGGNPEKAKRYFERALALTQGKNLLVFVLYAKTYAVQVQDKELFHSLLSRALAAPADDSPPEQRLANEIAKIKARKLLDAEDELF